MTDDTMYKDTKHLSREIGQCLNEFVLFNPADKSFVMTVDGSYVTSIVKCIHNPLEIKINVYLPLDIVSQIVDFYKKHVV